MDNLEERHGLNIKWKFADKAPNTVILKTSCMRILFYNKLTKLNKLVRSLINLNIDDLDKKKY